MITKQRVQRLSLLRVVVYVSATSMFNSSYEMRGGEKHDTRND